LREGWEGIERRARSFSPNQTKREYNKNRKFPPRRKLTIHFAEGKLSFAAGDYHSAIGGLSFAPQVRQILLSKIRI